MRGSLALLALLGPFAAPAAAQPAMTPGPPAMTPGPTPVDNTGAVVSVAVSGGAPAALGAEAEIGWRFDPRAAVLARASTGVYFWGAAYRAYQLGVRWWPVSPTNPSPRIYAELRAGVLQYGEPYDCQPQTNPMLPSYCWGGDATGQAYGLQVGGALTRGPNASLDMFGAVDVHRWRDFGSGASAGGGGVRVGFALTFE